MGFELVGENNVAKVGLMITITAIVILFIFIILKMAGKLG